jgi:hypothetical protein
MGKFKEILKLAKFWQFSNFAYNRKKLKRTMSYGYHPLIGEHNDDEGDYSNYGKTISGQSWHILTSKVKTTTQVLPITVLTIHLVMAMKILIRSICFQGQRDRVINSKGSVSKF